MTFGTIKAFPSTPEMKSTVTGTEHALEPHGELVHLPAVPESSNDSPEMLLNDL